MAPHDSISAGCQAADDAGISTVVHRNIRAITEMRQETERRLTASDRLARRVTALMGAMWCLSGHILFYGGWIAINSHLMPGIKFFDPFPFPMLTMIAAVEAILLAIFILISQNRMQRLADRRADL